uniref:Uncharacterized protein n=1 Tax=Anguilla anguilla TaxID=7936 RepID=A0A0E9XCR9_ANGAN
MDNVIFTLIDEIVCLWQYDYTSRKYRMQVCLCIDSFLFQNRSAGCTCHQTVYFKTNNKK